MSCKNCVHWRLISNKNYKDCIGPYGECKLIDEFHEIENAWLHYSKEINDLSIDVSLLTNENFYCSEFEA